MPACKTSFVYVWKTMHIPAKYTAIGNWTEVVHMVNPQVVELQGVEQPADHRLIHQHFFETFLQMVHPRLQQALQDQDLENKRGNIMSQ